MRVSVSFPLVASHSLIVLSGYLADVERAVWVVGDDDEDMPPLYFDTAEAALLAYYDSQRAVELRAKRRDEALHRLGKVAGR